LGNAQLFFGVVTAMTSLTCGLVLRQEAHETGECAQ
jgi:hypothetical protein